MYSLMVNNHTPAADSYLSPNSLKVDETMSSEICRKFFANSIMANRTVVVSYNEDYSFASLM